MHGVKHKKKVVSFVLFEIVSFICCANLVLQPLKIFTWLSNYLKMNLL